MLEAGKLAGRAQDWNASRREVEELVAHGIISQSDLDDIIGIEFNPMRCAFEGGEPHAPSAPPAATCVE